MTDKPMTIEQLKEELKDSVSCVHSDLNPTASMFRTWEDRSDLENYTIISHYLRDAQEIIDKILLICEENEK